MAKIVGLSGSYGEMPLYFDSPTQTSVVETFASSE